MKNDIAILILAAGSSSRMGKTKQLLPWKNTSLLGNAIKTAKASKASEVVVVLGAKATHIRETLADTATVFLENKDWAKGMGTSISCGVKYYLNNTTALKGVLIMLSDQPLINTSYLNRMIDAFGAAEKNIIGTAYGERVGAPALFGSHYFSDLSELHGDDGAQRILSKNQQHIAVLNAGKITKDIDTEEDYASLLQKL